MMMSSNGNISALYLPFVRGIHRGPVNCPHKGQWREALMFSLICAWTNGWVTNRNAGRLRRHRARYGVTVIISLCLLRVIWSWVFAYTHYYIRMQFDHPEFNALFYALTFERSKYCARKTAFIFVWWIDASVEYSAIMKHNVAYMRWQDINK